jgi:hypothetical protein
MLKTDKFLLRASLKPSTLIRDQFLSTSTYCVYGMSKMYNLKILKLINSV